MPTKTRPLLQPRTPRYLAKTGCVSQQHAPPAQRLPILCSFFSSPIPRVTVKQPGGRTLFQNSPQGPLYPLGRHDIDSLTPSSYLNLLFPSLLMEYHKHKNLRAFLPDTSSNSYLPTSFLELYLHQRSFATSAD